MGRIRVRFLGNFYEFLQIGEILYYNHEMELCPNPCPPWKSFFLAYSGLQKIKTKTKISLDVWFTPLKNGGLEAENHPFEK